MAVVVIYHPPADLPERIVSLLKIVTLVSIVDNTPCPISTTIPTYLATILPNPQITYLALRQNRGVAIALNCAVAHAKAAREVDSDIQWLVMLDQDSDPPTSFLADLASLLASAHDRDQLALIGINYQDTSGTRQTAHPIRPGLTPAKAVITSGSLLRLDAATEVGPFSDDYFIDEVDHEYALRLRRAGFHVALASSVLMPHNLGAMRRIHLPSFTFGVSNHPPTRRYYMARNRIALTKTYLFFDPAFVLTRLALTLWESLIVLFFEKQKISKLAHTLKGIIHGILGRMGPLNSTILG